MANQNQDVSALLDNEQNKENVDLFKDYLSVKSKPTVSQGDIVDGVIISIQGDFAYIDVNYKAEGKVRLTEFDEPVKVGDKVKVFIVQIKDSEGVIVLSKARADFVTGRKHVQDSYASGEMVEGVLLKKIKGGYVVLVSGVQGFLPNSQSTMDWRSEDTSMIGEKVRLKVINRDFGQKGGYVFSMKAFLDEELKEKRVAFFENKKEGDVVKGLVKKVLDYGAFLELEQSGVYGFLYIKDVAWNHTENIRSVLREGESFNVKILKINYEDQKVNVSIKHLEADPWDTFAEHCKVGDILKGVVLKFVRYGAFVLLDDYKIEGLLHIDEISWTAKVRNLRDFLTLHGEIKVKVLSIDIEAKRISLSLKDVIENPWDSIKKKYYYGLRVSGKVVYIHSSGVYIELEHDLHGFVSSHDIFWISENEYDAEKNCPLEMGKIYDFIVLNVDVDRKNVVLSYKHTQEDPLIAFKNNYSTGHALEAKVTWIGKSGMRVYISLEEGFKIQSFLKFSEVEVDSNGRRPTYSVGDILSVYLSDIDLESRNVFITQRNQTFGESKHISYQRNVQHSATLGNFMGEKFSTDKSTDKNNDDNDVVEKNSSNDQQ